METKQRESFLQLIKKGNKSSAVAAIGNAAIAAAKGVAYFFSGSGSLFASSMHSLADCINQGFVFVGSVLSEKKPTARFPAGFGRLINIFCMVAVIVVSIMAYETILEGWHLIQHPAKSGALLLSVAVLLFNLIVDGAILVKAMKEIIKEAQAEAKGANVFFASFKHVGRATPPTRLVFYEDLVAVTGAFLALVAVVITAFTNFLLIDGIVTILIGCLMVGVAFRVGYDNMVGLIGVAAPHEIEEKVIKTILSDQDVVDIYKIRIIQEGRAYHVESYIELKKGLPLSEADDIKFRVRDKLLADQNISDVTLGVIEDDGIVTVNENQVIH